MLKIHHFTESRVRLPRGPRHWCGGNEAAFRVPDVAPYFVFDGYDWVQRYTDKCDTLVTSKPLNSFGEKACTHEYTCATVEGYSPSFVPIPSYVVTDYSSWYQRRNRSEMCIFDGEIPSYGAIKGGWFPGPFINAQWRSHGGRVSSAFRWGSFVVYVGTGASRGTGNRWALDFCVSLFVNPREDLRGSGHHLCIVPQEDLSMTYILLSETGIVYDRPDMARWWSLFLLDHPEYPASLASTKATAATPDATVVMDAQITFVREFLADTHGLRTMVTDYLSSVCSPGKIDGYYYQPSEYILHKGMVSPRYSRSDLRMLNSKTQILTSVHKPATPTIWGELGNECFDQVGIIDTNMIAYLAELKDVGSTIASGYEFMTHLGSNSYHDACSLWLSARYGDRLTVADTREILASCRDWLKSFDSATLVTARTRRFRDYADQCCSSELEKTGLTYYCLRAKPTDAFGLQKAVRLLQQYGLWLDSENAWDLVPFSFVADWFFNFGDALHALDRSLELSYWTVESVTRSDKVVTRWDPTILSSDLFHVTRIESVSYLREVRHKLDTKPFTGFQWSSPRLINWLDGLTLVCQ